MEDIKKMVDNYDASEEEIATGLAGLSPQELSRIRGIQATATSEMSPVAGAATTRTGEVVGLEEA
jgi:hypothetical protein